MGSMNDYKAESITFHPTTDRHSDLVFAMAGELRDLNKKGILEVWGDTVALVYDEEEKLINVNQMSLAEGAVFKRRLNQYGYVEPDVMIFKENASLNNDRNTRKAGCPDLVIEVWSVDNKEEHRQFKKQLYGTSEVTEHWYIEQESDIVECWKGNVRLPDQHLSDILVTQQGLEFDLRDKQTLDSSGLEEFVKYGFKG